ncbi:MAG: DUF4214 domain-containing protein [Sulfurimonas sp.]|jgi:hypothetical protein|uniref:DUF4214 domain-containing protein n=1 Tax=Sulfurimonas sp. TaxID=2022749 RepID=UPI00356248ED
MEENRLLLSELYTAYFNRAPDAAGLAYWLNELDNDVMDFGSIASNWANEQQEFTDTYGEDADSSVLITQVYANVLGRSPDTAGATYWAAELASGNIPMDQFVLAIVNGAKASTGSSSDAALLNNKAQVGIAMADAGINDLAFAAQVIATVTADSSTVGIVESVITMAAADTAGLANATATLESVQAILADTDSAATLTTTLANLKTVMQNLAEDVTAGTVTNIAATLTAATATVEAATQDASFVANPETLATSIAANPTAVEEDAAAVVEEATTPTTPTTPSTGGGGGSSTPATPTFTVTDTEGVVTFGGTATGNISMSITEDVATFTRGGINATTTVDFASWTPSTDYLNLSTQTLVLTPAQADVITSYATIESTTYSAIRGTGTINLTTSDITANTNLLSISNSLDLTFNAGADATVSTGITLWIHPQHADGSTITGAGNVQVSIHDYDTGPSTLDIQTTGTNFIGGTGNGDTITVGAGINQISAAGGADSITLGHDGTDYTGTDKVIVGVGTAAQTETHAITFQDLIAGQSVTVDGLTLTASGAIAAADVAAGFANLTNAASTEGSAVTNGTWSGAKSTAWTSGAVDTATVTFTSETANTNVTDIVVTSAGTAEIVAPTAVGAADTQGSAGTASDAAPSTTALESIINFDIATDELDLGYGTALLATSADTGIASITIGVVTFEASVITIEAMLTAVFTELADSNNTAAFVYSGNTYVVQGDGVAGMQDSDIMLQLTGVTDLTDLSGILV